MIEVTYGELDFDYELRALILSFFPGQVFGSGEEDREMLHIHFDFELEKIRIMIWTEEYQTERETMVSGEGDFHKHPDKMAHPYRTCYKNQVKSLLFQMLSSVPEDVLPEGFVRRIPAWGTMTGVRPTKIPMSGLLAGRAEEEVWEELKKLYHCSEEKSLLCMEIAKKETELLEKSGFEGGYSLYVGIPFCPTTCLYCSFPSYPMEQSGYLADQYLDALLREMDAGKDQCGLRTLTSVYIGGGTPTALSKGQLDRLLGGIRSCFPESVSCEFTVEAGRPDSITEEKLLVLRKYGVDRISVNPQTMQQKTLDLIGRKHTVKDTERAFLLARELGFQNINMDLIIGLPGETLEDFKDTLQQVKALAPDSITVHSLVVKRASRLREVFEETGYPAMREEARGIIMEQMLAYAEEELLGQGYHPYYMYRQKNSAGHSGSNGQENIGFSKEGKECLYNVLIMEEMQTILAFGAGASTKRYHPYRESQGVLGNGMVSRIENVKSIKDYIGRIDEMIDRKAHVFEWGHIG